MSAVNRMVKAAQGTGCATEKIFLVVRAAVSSLTRIYDLLRQLYCKYQHENNSNLSHTEYTHECECRYSFPDLEIEDIAKLDLVHLILSHLLFGETVISAQPQSSGEDYLRHEVSTLRFERSKHMRLESFRQIRPHLTSG